LLVMDMDIIVVNQYTQASIHELVHTNFGYKILSVTIPIQHCHIVHQQTRDK
jgi:hypothetical protein